MRAFVPIIQLYTALRRATVASYARTTPGLLHFATCTRFSTRSIRISCSLSLIVSRTSCKCRTPATPLVRPAPCQVAYSFTCGKGRHAEHHAEHQPSRGSVEGHARLTEDTTGSPPRRARSIGGSTAPCVTLVACPAVPSTKRARPPTQSKARRLHTPSPKPRVATQDCILLHPRPGSSRIFTSSSQ